MAEPIGYRAFISYSHADIELARRLHKWLETYEIPPGLGHPVDAFRPIFRDEDELAAGILDARLKQALARAGQLIVVASPAASQSRWVEQEVQHFLACHARDRVYAIVAAGMPNAPDADTECLPPSLRAGGHAQADQAEIFAPVISVSGEEAAFLRLAAGLLDISYGNLFDRHAEREAERQRQRSRSLARAYSAAADLAAASADHERALKYAAAYLIDTGDTQWEHAPELRRRMRDDAMVTRLRSAGGANLTPILAALSPDGRRCAFYAQEGILYVHDIKTNAVVFTASPPHVRALTFTADGAILIAVLNDGPLIAFDAASGDVVAKSTFADFGLTKAIQGELGELIVAGMSGQTRVITAANLRPRLQIMGQRKPMPRSLRLQAKASPSKTSSAAPAIVASSSAK
jgi:hypothetical protein